MTSDEALADLSRRYRARTRASWTHREALGGLVPDPRSTARYIADWSEMVYGVVCPRSDGCRLWDLDGNEYVDMAMGFGAHLFGHRPAFLVDAVTAQLADGWHLGADVSASGEAASAVAGLIDSERLAMVTTGSEAVHCALRVARALTGKTKIAMFAQSYHGWLDGQLATVDSDCVTVPAFPGVPQGAVQDVLVLQYGDPSALEALDRSRGELAAVLVEPIQNSRPDLQPREFLRALRAFADDASVPLVFDEMVTGFRLGTGGAQKWLGVRPDISIYGKVVGGGFPVGIVSGGAQFLDALDGGWWGQAHKRPAEERTLVVGTFARNPLTVAAVLAVAHKIGEVGPLAYDDLNRRSDDFATALAGRVSAHNAPFKVDNCGSMVRITSADNGLRELLSYHLMLRGVFVNEGRTWFVSMVHSEHDLALVVAALDDSLAEMTRSGWYGRDPR